MRASKKGKRIGEKRTMEEVQRGPERTSTAAKRIVCRKVLRCPSRQRL
jgi:hypothetical protein